MTVHDSSSTLSRQLPVFLISEYFVVHNCTVILYLYVLRLSKGAEYCDESVCLWVGLPARLSLRNHKSELHQIYVLVAYGCGLVLLWLYNNVLYFRFCGWRHVAYGGVTLYGSNLAALCVHFNTPAVWYWLLHWRQAPRLDESLVQGVSAGAECAIHHCVVEDNALKRKARS